MGFWITNHFYWTWFEYKRIDNKSVIWQHTVDIFWHSPCFIIFFLTSIIIPLESNQSYLLLALISSLRKYLNSTMRLHIGHLFLPQLNYYKYCESDFSSNHLNYSHRIDKKVFLRIGLFLIFKCATVKVALKTIGKQTYNSWIDKYRFWSIYLYGWHCVIVFNLISQFIFHVSIYL